MTIKYWKNRGIVVLLLCCLLSAIVGKVQAQEVRVIADLDSSTILIGEQTSLKVRVVYPAEQSARLVLPEDTLVTGVEIVSSNVVDSLQVNEQLRELVYNVVITSFDSATYQLDHVQAMVSGELYAPNTLPSLIVNTIPVDLAHPEVFSDIKEPWKPAFVWQDYLIHLYIFLGVLLSVFIIYFLIRYLRKQKQGEVGAKTTEPEKNPYEEAIDHLQSLKTSELWERNQVKAYYTELSDILRRYLWRVYGMNTYERTTAEILADFSVVIGKDRMYTELSKILQMADLAKFAKFYPRPEENVALLNASLAFVEEHKPEEEKEQQQQEEEEKKGGVEV